MIKKQEVTMMGGLVTLTAEKDSRNDCWTPTIYFNDQKIWEGDVWENRDDAIKHAEFTMIKHLKWEFRGYK